jgi:hypothetical protein
VKGLRQRLDGHATGRRSGDQFCVYVADRLTLATFSATEIAQIAAGELSFDARIRRYIHERLSYPWVDVRDGVSAYALEAQICHRVLAAGLPLLNREDRVSDSRRAMPKFRVMHPWGPDKSQQGTLQSEHANIAEAFAAIDAMGAQMVRTGAPRDALDLVVADESGNVVPRPVTH